MPTGSYKPLIQITKYEAVEDMKELKEELRSEGLNLSYAQIVSYLIAQYRKERP